MHLTVAVQLAVTMSRSGVNEPHNTRTCRQHYVPVKVDEMGVVGGSALCTAYAVRIMTGIAWRSFLINMFVVLPEGDIPKDGGPAVTPVAQLIRRS